MLTLSAPGYTHHRNRRLPHKGIYVSNNGPFSFDHKLSRKSFETKTLRMVVSYKRMKQGYLFSTVTATVVVGFYFSLGKLIMQNMCTEFCIAFVCNGCFTFA